MVKDKSIKSVIITKNSNKSEDVDYEYQPDYYRDPDYNIPDECDLTNKPHNRDQW